LRCKSTKFTQGCRSRMNVFTFRKKGQRLPVAIKIKMTRGDGMVRHPLLDGGKPGKYRCGAGTFPVCKPCTKACKPPQLCQVVTRLETNLLGSSGSTSTTAETPTVTSFSLKLDTTFSQGHLSMSTSLDRPTLIPFVCALENALEI
jgi:hypothetical protein